MEFKDDLYAILNVPEYSSISTVKYAYHTLAKKYHPDTSKHDGKIFAQVTDAYKILSNPITKQNYDSYLQTKHQKEEQERLNKTTQETKEAFNQTKQNFTESAASVLNETEDDLLDENDTSSKYYVNPKNEPIFTVIRHFNHYRFENAIGAIWHRSFFAILGAAILYTILTPISIFFKICDCGVNKHNYKLHWLATLNTNLQNPKIIKPTFWTIFLYILTITKAFTNICKTIYWIFRRIIILFLIPNAIRSLRRR